MQPSESRFLNPSDCGSSSIADDATEKAAKFFQPDSFQNVPSLLLIDLGRKNADGESVMELQDFAVYALLKSHSRKTGSCYPSHARLARLAAVSVSTIQRSLKRLADAGHIQRKSHNKGKIIMLTDMAGGTKILRREKIIFAPPKREVCPPEFQDVMRDASTEDNFFGTKFSAENESEETPPTTEETLPPSARDERREPPRKSAPE